ncbi:MULTISPECIES: hypothetical protein [Comamonas]|jgi:hypothetical protein|uniref:hypothetical protein n=1 Tax=Comamonas TaxID=283 RepID=UPI001039FA5F|nr:MULTISPECIES: hypothetical protein [Comamonas]TFF54514.1 hypothetical protein EIC84_25110 [Comamonas sp. A23]
MQREDLAITIAPAPQALQPEIISHSISHDDHARSPNVPMKNSDVDIDNPDARSAQPSNAMQLEAEHGWDVYPDRMA